MITDEEARELTKEFVVVFSSLREYCWNRGDCCDCPMDNKVCKVINCEDDDD